MINKELKAGWVGRDKALGQSRGKKDLERKTVGTLGVCVDYEKRKGSLRRGKLGQ